MNSKTSGTTIQFGSTEISFRCQKDNPISINAQIVTDRRRVRKAPNALAVATDVYGKPNGVKADEYYLPGGEKARLRPHRIQLEDSSNQVMLIAARQSRKFGEMDPDVVQAVHDTKLKPISAQEMGFWKNTLLKVKLVEKSSCLGEQDKMFADVLDTTSALTKSEGNQLIIPLDGSQGNVNSFYHPYGVIGKVLSVFGGPLDLELRPGAMYEFRVSMQQQGLPFYENGCRNGAVTCDEKDVNPAMYSEELVIEFQADPKVDRRSWLQKFENFHSKKLWNKSVIAEALNEASFESLPCRWFGISGFLSMQGEDEASRRLVLGLTPYITRVRDLQDKVDAATAATFTMGKGTMRMIVAAFDDAMELYRDIAKEPFGDDFTDSDKLKLYDEIIVGEKDNDDRGSLAKLFWSSMVHVGYDVNKIYDENGYASPFQKFKRTVWKSSMMSVRSLI